VRRVLAWGGVLGVVLLIAGVAGGWWYLDRYMHSPGPSAEERVVILEPGSGLGRIAERLAEVGVVDEPWLFRAGARLLGRDRDLKAGEYAIPARASPLDVIAILESGRVVQHRITVQEGLTVAEVMQLVEAHEVLEGPLPEAPPEGRLLPETYFFERGVTRAEIVRRMRTAMDEALAAAWAERAADLPLEGPEEALILASIIEKETALPEEYGVVASVFVNRLRRGMRLQTDPTVIYALTEGEGPLGRQLLRRDLEVDHPYNTYENAGLPPGPIANPGRGALHAAVNPDETDYLYFVADGSGGHAFARTLAEHNRNVARWRRLRDGG